MIRATKDKNGNKRLKPYQEKDGELLSVWCVIGFIIAVVVIFGSLSELFGYE
jgi:hypothetical protein